MWRPEGFKNPYPLHANTTSPYEHEMNIKHLIWEECADAMLEVLRKKGVRTDDEIFLRMIKENGGNIPIKQGTTVFIPDDEK